MLASSRPHVSPALVVSALALFFALGGSAFAVKNRSSAAPSPFQKRCATGAVKGIAIVTGEPTKGIENLETEYTAAANVFGARWSCTGGAIQVRRAGAGVDVRFVGNSAATAIVSTWGDTIGPSSVYRRTDGAFHVTSGVRGTGGDIQRREVPFVLVVL